MRRYLINVIQLSVRLPVSALILLVLCPLLSWGQNLDSLEQVLEYKQLNDSERIRIYQKLSESYANRNLQKSMDFAEAGLALALRVGDEQKQVLLYRDIEMVYLNRKQYDSAFHILDKALSLAQKIKNSALEGMIYRLYGNVYAYKNQYDTPLVYYQKAIAIFEPLNDTYELSKTYNAIGGLYRMLNLYDRSEKYYKKAEQIALQGGNNDVLAEIYTDLSTVYRMQERPVEEWEAPIKKALEIFQEIGDQYSAIRARIILANTYSNINENDKALVLAQQALQQAEEAGFFNLAISAGTVLSAVQYYSGDYKSSIKSGQNVLRMDSTDVNMIKHVYVHLALAYGQLQKFDSMEHYLNQFMLALQEQYDASYQKLLSELEVKYETEKKELKIAALEKQRQLYIWLGIAGGVILLGALAFAFIRYRLAVSRRKLAEEETQRLEQEKQLVAVQATLDGEAAERSRLAKDLHDGLGGMLSAVKLNLPQVKGNAVLETIDVSRFQTALGMLDDSIRELRRVAHHMMPESLLRYGLKVSLADFCEAIPSADFHYFGNEARLPEKMEIMVYRCIHELVNNALKHASAEHINVQLVQEADRLSFTVQDNGKGFDQQNISEGIGLQNIRQRVAAFQGKMDIYSSKKGTEVHIELEQKKEESHD